MKQLSVKFFKENDLPRDFQTCKTAEFQQPLGRYNSARSTCRSWAISRARGGAGGVTSGGTNKMEKFGGTSTYHFWQQKKASTCFNFMSCRTAACYLLFASFQTQGAL